MLHINYTFIFVYQKKKSSVEKKKLHTRYISRVVRGTENSQSAVRITSWVFPELSHKGQNRVHNQGWSPQSMTSWVTLLQRVSLQSRVSVQSLTSWGFPNIPQGHHSLHSDTQR